MQTMQIRHQIKIVCSWSQSQAKYPLKIAGYPRVSVSQSTKHKKKKKQTRQQVAAADQQQLLFMAVLLVLFPLFEKCERWKRKCWLKIVSSIRMPCT